MEPKSAARNDSLIEKSSRHATCGKVSLEQPAGVGRGTLFGTLLSMGILAAALGACGPETDDGGGGLSGPITTSSSSGGGMGGAGGGAVAVDPYQLYLAIEPKLVQTCRICHKENGAADAPFLAGNTPAERYASVTSWPGIVTASPAQSILLTHPDEPTHGGGEAPPMPAEIKPGVIEWLTAESKNAPDVVEQPGPSLKPFKPILGGAFNTVYLGTISPELEFASISFNAKAIGGTTEDPTMLWLTNLTVHTVPDKPVHVVHPLFTVYPPGLPASPDPVDAFSNVDQTFTIDGNPTLGTGEIILTNWTKGSYLGLAFELLEVYGGNAGGGAGCKDITSFITYAVPAMQTCMMKCHGGTDPQAKGTMNLSELNIAVPTSACIEVRARIKPTVPDDSQIFQVTDPLGLVVHKYKFEGSTEQHTAFKTGILPWVLAEQ